MDILLEYETEKKFSFDYEKIIQDVIEEAIKQYACPYDIEVSVTITDNKRIQQINRRFREIDAATDVLSFPMLEYDTPGDFSHISENMDVFNPDTGCLLLGDIMISYDKVIEQANAYGHSEQRELAFLVAHSMLHLFGYDHIIDSERVDMEKRQEHILQKRGYSRTKEDNKCAE